MATDGGPNIERVGLVFGMDTGYGVANNSTATRFYRGGPTENKITNVGVSKTGWSEYGWSGSFVTTSDHENTFELTSTNGWHNATFNHGVSTGTINVSFEYKLKSKQTTGIWGFVLNGTHLGTYTNWIGSLNSTNLPSLTEWKTFSGTYSGNGDTKLAIGLRGSDSQGLTDTMYVKNLQVENKDHQTPFVNGVRTSTQSLIDLTKSTNIDVSNVSFDSTGQPTFDGTDDYSQISLTGVNLDNGCTIEGVLKRNSTPTAWRTFFNIKSASSNTPFFEFRSGGNAQHIYADYYNVASEWSTTAATLPTGDFGHAVACYDGNGNIKMYFNGELIGTTTGVDSFTLGTGPRLTIGRAYSNDRYTDIVAPIVKVYNRPLLPEEVQQNYNTYKNRFNL